MEPTILSWWWLPAVWIFGISLGIWLGRYNPPVDHTVIEDADLAYLTERAEAWAEVKKLVDLQDSNMKWVE